MESEWDRGAEVVESHCGWLGVSSLKKSSIFLMAYGDCRKQQTVRARPSGEGNCTAIHQKKKHTICMRDCSDRSEKFRNPNDGPETTKLRERSSNWIDFRTAAHTAPKKNEIAIFMLIISSSSSSSFGPRSCRVFVWLVRFDSSIFVLCNIHTSATECCPLRPIAEFQIIFTK